MLADTRTLTINKNCRLIYKMNVLCTPCHWANFDQSAPIFLREFGRVFNVYTNKIRTLSFNCSEYSALAKLHVLHFDKHETSHLSNTSDALIGAFHEKTS